MYLRKPEFAWARGAAGSVSVTTLARGIGIVNAILLARLLQPAGYGLYSYAYAIAALLLVPAQFGIPMVVTREVAKSESQQQWGVGRGVIRWAHGCVAAFSLTILFAAGLYFAVAGRGLTTSDLLTYSLAMLLVPVLSLDALRGAILFGLRRVVLGQLPNSLIQPLAMLVVLLFAVLFAPNLLADPFRAMILLLVAATIAYVVGGGILLVVRPSELVQTKPCYAMKRWSLSAFPIGLNQGLQLINQYTSIILLGVFATKVEVGQFRIALLGAGLVIMALGAINSTFSPYYARSAARNDRAAMQYFVTRSAQLALLAAVPAAIVYLFAGGVLLDILFGESFRAAWLPLVILAFGQVVNAFTGSSGTLMYMSNHERDVVVSVGVGATLNVILNLILIPMMGMNGAAVATATSVIMANVVLCGWVWKRHRIVVGPLRFGAMVRAA